MEATTTIEPGVPLCDHGSRRRAADQERAVEVDGHELAPRIEAGLEERRRAVDAGVADHDVQPAMPIERGRDQPLDIRLHRDVAGDQADPRPRASPSAIRASRSASRAIATTEAPSSRNRCVTAAPMPVLAPVTMATRPASRCSAGSSGDRGDGRVTPMTVHAGTLARHGGWP